MLTEARYPDLPEWLRELYPFRTRTLEVGGYRLSFVDEGPPQAPPLVLLHGNPTWSFLYRHLIEAARAQYRVIAPDHVGFGLSDKPATPAYHTLAQHVSNFTTLVEALRLEKITLAMNGWGGPIGLGYAVTHPQNIARLVLANTWGFNPPHLRTAKVPFGMRLANWGRLGAWLDSLLNLSMHAAFSSEAHRAMGDLGLEAYTYPFRKASSWIAPLAFTRMFFTPDPGTVEKLSEIQNGLKNLDAPAAILWGVRDRRMGKLPPYMLRDELKHASEPVFLPDQGHYLPEEAPGVLAEVVLHAAKPAQPVRPDNVFKIIG